MTITEKTVESKIEWNHRFRCINVQLAIVIERDGKELTRTVHRAGVIMPGETSDRVVNDARNGGENRPPMSEEDIAVMKDAIDDMIAKRHTPEVIAAYQAALADSAP